MAIIVETWTEWQGAAEGRWDGFFHIFDDFDDTLETSSEKMVMQGYADRPAGTFTMPWAVHSEEMAEKVSRAVGEIILDDYYKVLKADLES